MFICTLLLDLIHKKKKYRRNSSILISVQEGQEQRVEKINLIKKKNQMRKKSFQNRNITLQVYTLSTFTRKGKK